MAQSITSADSIPVRSARRINVQSSTQQPDVAPGFGWVALAPITMAVMVLVNVWLSLSTMR